MYKIQKILENSYNFCGSKSANFLTKTLILQSFNERWRTHIPFCWAFSLQVSKVDFPPNHSPAFTLSLSPPLPTLLISATVFP